MNKAFPICLCGFCAVLLFLLSLSGAWSALPVASEEATSADFSPVIVLDAGHGGEDGGASSADGLIEKDVNLTLCRMLRAYFIANGWKTVMTRTDDRLLYDRNADFQGHKKALDLAARLQIAQKVSPALFVSVHMNAFPALPSCCGTQVFYSVNHPLSRHYAESVQNAAADFQPNNRRVCKAAGSSIYLLHHLQLPAILVEAGFLSNPAEASLLADENYLASLAFVIFRGIVSAYNPKPESVSSSSFVSSEIIKSIICTDFRKSRGADHFAGSNIFPITSCL